MIHNLHKLVTPFLCLVLLKILPGCAPLAYIAVQTLVPVAVEPLADVALDGFIYLSTTPPDPYSHRTGKNFYEPMILASSKDRVSVKYLSVGPNAEHKQVLQLIIEHCDGNYIETNRAELRGYTTVEAECTHGNESMQ
jgi:hypothetical protein